MTRSTEYERVRREHNAAVANGLILKARHLARVLDALEAGVLDAMERIDKPATK